NQTPPQFEDFKAADFGGREEAWKAFKDTRRQWNLTYEMAGPVPASLKEAEQNKFLFDAADLADTLDEYEAIVAEKQKIDHELALRDTVVTKTAGLTTNIVMKIGDHALQIKGKKEDIKRVDDLIAAKRLKLGDIRITGTNKGLDVFIKDMKFQPFDAE